MNKEQFLRDLDDALKPLSAEEREDIRRDYDEHFVLGKEEGKTEAEIAEALGSPRKIGKEILAVYQVEKAQSKASTGNILRAVWAGIGLGFLNLILVLGPFIALVAVLASGWIAAGSFVLSPLLVLVNAILYPGTFEWFDLFVSVATAGFGLLLGIFMYFLSKGLVWMFVRYLKWNVNLVRGG
ncbi:DUF1700 domain-containing protein [Virgibacillus sp. 179-BFC.A HS]|uniref:DUF1700 domain-containing protein n=1 Tax=Tigheibacillus jepli TaxID=3035914 RepID=A0ABU5CMM3_9BACI|nr:DUF1700 domain-containing protein [Virgibacillus sp. 179-BFC.A HS]MDY0407082.1 DUF1700 domain-containing protein [Virgibacillus sp. 179-BFC.A HS]